MRPGRMGAAFLAGAAACAHPAPVPPPATPEPLDTRPPLEFAPALPPVPLVDGPLQLRVVYPPAGAEVDASDSTFLFGSVGSGRAELRINNRPVTVAPNGTWLAWLPLPTGDDWRFELSARRGDDSASLVLPLRRAPHFRAPDRGLWVDTTSFTPSGQVWWPELESLPLGVRATPGASVRLRLPDGRLVPFGPAPGFTGVSEGLRAFGRDSASQRVRPAGDRYTAVLARAITIGPPLGAVTSANEGVAGEAVLEVARNGDTLRVRWPLQVSRLTEPLPWVELNDDPRGLGGTDGVTVGRALPQGSYHWFFPAGTRVAVSGRRNGDLRLRLAENQVAWVSASEVVPMASGVGFGPAVMGSLTTTTRQRNATIRIPMSARAPYQVVETAHGVELDLYSTVADGDWIRYGPTGGPLRQIAWRQVAADVVRITADLESSLWGYRLRWDHNDLLLELRSPPAIDPAHPLRGRLIVVDAGHPPAGATGPSGLTEAEANLGVALMLERLLIEEGARVVMTRRGETPLDLWPRVKLADSVDADLLVSIHNNALPDGVNPFENNGSSVFYFHPRSLPLARAVQAELLRHLPLRDLGVGRGDLALVRGTWMPSILVEGMFMLIPEQEAALRTDAGRRAYAEAVRSGIRTFLKGGGV